MLIWELRSRVIFRLSGKNEKMEVIQLQLFRCKKASRQLVLRASMHDFIRLPSKRFDESRDGVMREHLKSTRKIDLMTSEGLLSVISHIG